MHNGHRHDDVPAWARRLVPSLIVLVMMAVYLLPPGVNPSFGGHAEFDPETGDWEWVHGERPAAVTWGRIMGQNTFLLLVVSVLFAYRRPMGWVVREPVRVRLHKGVGIAILALAVAHGVLLPLFGVTRGWLSGLIATLLLGLHATTGFAKATWIRRIGAARWRYLHLATAYAGLLLGIQHTTFFGQHFGIFREALYGVH